MLIIKKDHEAMSREAADEIIKIIKKYTNGLYCFAGGDTPVKTLQLLVEAHKSGEVDLTKAYYIELDEWVGIDISNPGSCAAYLHKNLFEPASIPQDHFHLFDAKSENLQEECTIANNYIEIHGGITLSLLGVGVNGHLGFNEPGVDLTSTAHVIDLDESTKIVGKKYFDVTIGELSQGITLGIGQLMQSKYFMVIASGLTKQKAIERLQKGKVTNECPVTVANKHTNAIVIVDEATQ